MRTLCLVGHGNDRVGGNGRRHAKALGQPPLKGRGWRVRNATISAATRRSKLTVVRNAVDKVAKHVCGSCHGLCIAALTIDAGATSRHAERSPEAQSADAAGGPNRRTLLDLPTGMPEINVWRRVATADPVMQMANTVRIFLPVLSYA